MINNEERKNINIREKQKKKSMRVGANESILQWIKRLHQARTSQISGWKMFSGGDFSCANSDRIWRAWIVGFVHHSHATRCLVRRIVCLHLQRSFVTRIIIYGINFRFMSFIWHGSMAALFTLSARSIYGSGMDWYHFTRMQTCVAKTT